MITVSLTICIVYCFGSYQRSDISTYIHHAEALMISEESFFKNGDPFQTMDIAWNESCDDESGYVSSSPQPCPKNADKLIWDTVAHPAFGCELPSRQEAIVTPEMGPQLNLCFTSIPVREPRAGEAVVRVRYTGLCRSVCHLHSIYFGLLLTAVLGCMFLNWSRAWLSAVRPRRWSRRYRSCGQVV